MSNISRFLLVIFQPLLIPLYSLLLLSLYTEFFSLYKYGIKSFLLPVILLTFIIPLVFTIILKSTGYIQDIELTKAKDRILSYLIFIISNSSLVYIFSQLNVPTWFLIFLSSPIAVALCGFIANFFCRVSMHMLAFGNAIGIVIYICFMLEGINPYGLIMILFLISGLIAVSELYIANSSPAQVYSGFLIGLIATYLYFNLFIVIIRNYNY